MKKSFSVGVALFLALAGFSPLAMATPLGGYGNGGAQLQAVLDGITVGGTSSVNVNTDDIPEVNDAMWSIGGAGGSVATLVVELAGFAGTNTFGIYNGANQVEIFNGAAGSGDQRLISILADGSVYVNFIDTGVDFAGNKFGFYLGDAPGNPNHQTHYSDTSLNTDSVDHMVAFQGQGDSIQIPPFAAGVWTSNEFILAWEDRNGGGDRNYTDFVVLVESIAPCEVPEPTSASLLLLGLMGVAQSVRRRV